MSLRQRLAHKQRRRAAWLVQVTDPDQAQARVAAARAQLDAARAMSLDPDALDALAGEVAQAEVELAATTETVEFQALAPDEFEALLAAHSDTTGDVDSTAMRAALAAACAVDEDLRDEQWWTEQLASGRWSKGEVDDLYYLLFTVLNYSVPRGAYTKG